MSLVRYALRTTENYAVAEEMAQDTFMQLYQALRTGKTIAHPKAWTICVLRRTLNRQLKNEIACEPLDDLEIAGTATTELSRLGDIRSLLSLLSPREEEVLLLRLEALKYREIAEQLNISMNSVNTLLARALCKLQQATARPITHRRETPHANTEIFEASQ